MSQLPALQIIVPMLGAPLCVLLRNPRGAWLVYLAVCWTGLLVSAALLWQVHDTGTIRYALGGWQPPVGIEYRIDALNAFVALIVSLVGAVVAPYARRSVASEIPEPRAYLFYAMLCLVLCGLLGITLTGDAFNLFVFLEISSLASYALIAMGRQRRALLAAFQYLVMGTIGGTFILIGVGFLYMMTGTLNMVDLADRLPAVDDTRTVAAALAFIVIGTGIKVALMPLHIWLPNAYTYAPSVVSAFLAATATKVAAYALIRFLYTVFGAGYAFGSMPLDSILVTLAVVAMLYGSLAAVFQTDLKRLLAWSSIAQIGYIVLGLALATTAGLTASVLHLLNHAAVKGALFLAVGAMAWRVGGSRLSDLAGLGQSMPWTGAAFVAGGLGLIGVPLTAGFVSKWYLLAAVIAEGRWALAAAVLVASLLAVIYIWRVIEALYFHDPAPGHAERREAPAAMLAATWTLAVLNIGLGAYAEPAVTAARAAAVGLMGGAS